MKNALKFFFVLLVSLASFALPASLNAQGPPPPPGENGKGTSNNQGAPIDGGLTVMLLFATGIAGREWYLTRKRR
jgi:hypothetical protein